MLQEMYNICSEKILKQRNREKVKKTFGENDREGDEKSNMR